MINFLRDIDWHHHHRQFLSKSKENNENDMARHVFWPFFYSIRWPIQIVPTADCNSAAILPPIFPCFWPWQLKLKLFELLVGRINFNLKSISINFIYRFIPMVRSLKADGAIALMDVQEQVSLPLHSHFIKKSLKMSQWEK